MRWTGRFSFSLGFYRFTTRADDGVRLWVGGGSPVIDAWRDQAPTSYSTVLFMLRREYEVRLEYYEAGGRGQPAPLESDIGPHVWFWTDVRVPGPEVGGSDVSLN
ncbi:PA14 domain-containing protein [Cystobacter fuscus]